jgi:hypothetical protein
MVSGTIIGESIRVGAALDGIPLTVRRIRRGGPEQLSPRQEAAGMPSRWTLIEFEIDDHDAPAQDPRAWPLLVTPSRSSEPARAQKFSSVS